MSKKNLSNALESAIVALQNVATELKKEERQCKTTACHAPVHRTKCVAVATEFTPWGGWAMPEIDVEICHRDGQGRCRNSRGQFAPCGCTAPKPTPLPQWGVAGEPKEDKNKIFGIEVRVDEPRREDYRTRWEFERDHAKFDNLVDAAEACTWKNKSNTAPLHKVDAIRRRVEDGPVMGVNLVGETHWW